MRVTPIKDVKIGAISHTLKGRRNSGCVYLKMTIPKTASDMFTQTQILAKLNKNCKLELSGTNINNAKIETRNIDGAGVCRLQWIIPNTSGN